MLLFVLLFKVHDMTFKIMNVEKYCPITLLYPTLFVIINHAVAVHGKDTFFFFSICPVQLALLRLG
jgi:hypothetical protein